MSPTYIPKELTVGFKNLNKDNNPPTEERLLGFPTYKERSGKLRRQTGLQQFADKDSECKQFHNTPERGFVLLDTHQDSYSYRSYEPRYRVQDPRGFEVEIPVRNLFHILKYAGLTKLEFNDEYVYGFGQGGVAQLVPVNSEWHKEAIAYTELQDAVFEPSELVTGNVYEFKDSYKYLYMGQFHMFATRTSRNESVYDTESSCRIQRHVFVQQRDKPHPETGSMYGSAYFRPMSKLTEIGRAVEIESMDIRYDLLKQLNAMPKMHTVLEVLAVPKKLEWEENNLLQYNNYVFLDKKDYYLQLQVYPTNNNYGYWNEDNFKKAPIQYRMSHAGTWYAVQKPDFIQIQRQYTPHNDYVREDGKSNLFTQEELNEMNFVELQVKLSNGDTIKLMDYYQALHS